MPFLNGLLTILDSRSFSSIWFWLMLTVAWTWVGRSVLGVPHDIIRRASRRSTPEARPEHTEALALLDWLSLVLPRWRVAPTEAVWLIAIASFVLSTLLFLGFGYGFEMAQALFLLIVPFMGVGMLNLYLARRLRLVLAGAHVGRMDPDEAAARAARLMQRHRFTLTALSILVVAICAFWGALWMVIHPFGY